MDHDPLALRDVTYRFAQADNRLTALRQRGRSLYPYADAVDAQRPRSDRWNSRCRAFFGRIGASHKTLIEYPDAVHTLEFEPEPERYFADLADWIGRTIAE